MIVNAAYIRRVLSGHYEPREASALSRIICTEMLHQGQTDYFLCKDIEISEKDADFLQSVLERLGNDEPIQQIQGFSYFLGRKFAVTRDVLIPRPETEELVELIQKQAAAPARILDIGTGSGCIAVSLALGFPGAEVVAWDVSASALRVAERNAVALQAEVHFSLQDVFTYQPKGDEDFDIVVSNPPYVTESEKAGMEANVLNWEPSLALFVPDEDPLLFYRQIGKLGRRLLNKGGSLYLEINRSQGKQMECLLESLGYRKVTVRRDISGNERIVCAVL